MRITNPKKPVQAGIISALIISSLVVGGIYLYPYLLRLGINPEFREEIQLPKSVMNDFGAYDLQSYNYTPSIIPTPIKSGLSNVDLQELEGELTSEMIQQLEDYGFAIVDRGIEDIFHPMYYDDFLDTPMYISTDFCLHVLHSIFDNCLRIMELEYFYSNFSLMLNTLREEQMDLYLITTDPGVKDSLKYNVAYLTVLMYQLDNLVTIPSYVNTLVSSELGNIDQSVRAASPIFGYEEDYSQYTPRGHYTRNEQFERYFKAMMYAGRMGFILDDLSLDNSIGIHQTRMALALVYSFSLEINDETVWNYWDNICRTTNFLVGGSDDLTPVDYFTIWEQAGSINFADLNNDTFVEEIIISLKELRAPKINSRYTAAFEGAESIVKGFRLFGQSYTPDAYIFQELVYDNLPDRYIPKALDIFSVFGSERAEFHLDSEKSYTGYEEKIIELRDEFGNLGMSNWTQNIYWQWLYTLLPLLEEKEAGYPRYMQSDTWTDKSLVTSLGSWVELKHDTILYAKQSYTVLGLGDQVVHYVEPYPKVYSRIAATLRMLKEGLQTRGVLYENSSSSTYYSEQIFSNFTLKFDELAKAFDILTELSIKELQNEELSENEMSFIHHLGKKFQTIVSFNYGATELYQNEADKRTALIADVHTDPNSGQVLEVAVGNPFLIYVIVQDHTGSLFLTRGVTFSYYEFLQPYDQRLTDEEWQTILDSSPPALPLWITDNIPITTDSISIDMSIAVPLNFKKK